MDFKKFGNFNWIEMDSKDQNLDLIWTKRINLCPFQSIFVCWVNKTATCSKDLTRSPYPHLKTVYTRQGCRLSRSYTTSSTSSQSYISRYETKCS